MNRIIKFRAWDKKFKHMYDLRKCIGFDISDLTEQRTHHKNLIVMQFTGLKDKNGVEVFKGDVVLVDWNDGRYSPHNAEVIWNDTDLCWEIEGGCLTTDNNHFEVIGNIYENPELLKSL